MKLYLRAYNLVILSQIFIQKSISVKTTNWNWEIVSWVAYKSLPITFFNDDNTEDFFKLCDSNVKIVVDTKKKSIANYFI